jgi:hypothetical protein
MSNPIFKTVFPLLWPIECGVYSIWLTIRHSMLCWIRMASWWRVRITESRWTQLRWCRTMVGGGWPWGWRRMRGWAKLIELWQTQFLCHQWPSNCRRVRRWVSICHWLHATMQWPSWTTSTLSCDIAATWLSKHFLQYILCFPPVSAPKKTFHLPLTQTERGWS